MNKKVLLTSLMSIAMLASVTAGATYALFTSNSDVNIAITSGTVDYKATIEDLTTYSPKLINTNGEIVDKTNVATGTKFYNGGTVNLNGGELKLTNMTPGDKVSFRIFIKNNSTVISKYQTAISPKNDTGLFNGLKVTINGQTYDGLTIRSDWTIANPDVDPAPISVEIELPSEATNAYQGKSVSLGISVNAVQSNTETVNPNPNVNEVEIYTADELVAFSNAVNAGNDFEGKTIKLMNTIDMEGYEYTPAGNVNSYPSVTFDGTFDGQNNTIKNLTTYSYDVNNAAAGLFGSITGVVKNLHMDNANVTSTHYAGAIVGYSSTNVGMSIENCKVTNSTIKTTPELLGDKYDNGDKAGGVIGYAVEGDVVKGCVVDNTKVSGYRDVGGLIGASAATLENNTVINSTITYDATNAYKDETPTTFGEVVGRVLGGSETGSKTSNNTVNGPKGSKVVYDATNKTAKIYDAAGLRQYRDDVNNGKTTDDQIVNDYTVTLENDIDLKNVLWEPIGQTGRAEFKGVFDGQGKTIYNLNIDSEAQHGKSYSSALFGWLESHDENIVIKNLTVDGATIVGHHNVGVIAGYTETDKEGSVLIENCHVKNATLISTHVNGDACGDKTGAIVGNLNSGKAENCSAENCTIVSGRDAGQLFGAGKEANVTNCKAINVVVSANPGCTGNNVRNEVIGRVL